MAEETAAWLATLLSRRPGRSESAGIGSAAYTGACPTAGVAAAITPSGVISQAAAGRPPLAILIGTFNRNAAILFASYCFSTYPFGPTLPQPQQSCAAKPRLPARPVLSAGLDEGDLVD